MRSVLRVIVVVAVATTIGACVPIGVKSTSLPYAADAAQRAR
jgi:hypothetical protein